MGKPLIDPGAFSDVHARIKLDDWTTLHQLKKECFAASRYLDNTIMMILYMPSTTAEARYTSEYKT